MAASKITRNGTSLTLSSEESIVFIAYTKRPEPERKFFLESLQDVQDHFDDVMQFWRTRCGGKKVYWVIDYANFDVNPKVSDAYVIRMREILDKASLAIVRYGGNIVQRSMVRFSSLKLHSSANLYESREEALKVVAALRSGTVPLS